MKSQTRRTFLKTSALAAASATLSARSWAQVAGANGDIRIAVVGLNGRGKNHLSSFKEVKGVRIVALCDADTAILDKTATTLGGDVKKFVDLRELLARSDIDAVSIATPNHLHSIQAIWACQAGKDVYLEKPISHNVWEGRKVIEAVTKYNRVVQAGTQIRSSYGIAEAVEWVRAGNLGKIVASRGLCYKRRDSIGKTSGPQPVPSTVNYDLWLGPVAMIPPRRTKFHYDWHWFWATGNGDLGNQGIHQMDVARWFLGEPGIAPHTLSVGGRLGYDDDGETPNTQVIVHDYAKAPLIFEVRGLSAKPGSEAMDKFLGASIGIVIHCEGGHVVVPTYTEAQAFDKSGKLLKEWKGSNSHFANFIDVVRSRRTADLRGPIHEGHVSSALCHTGNISYQLGKATPPDELREKIKGNAAMAEAFGRMSEHLGVHDVKLDKTPATLGLPLSFDTKSEKFTGNDVANTFVKPEYRAPYVIKV